MQSEIYRIPSLPACASVIASSLYSEQRIDKDLKSHLHQIITSHIPTNRQHPIKALVLGGRCGLTVQMLSEVCAEIDVVEEGEYYELLKERFTNNKEVEYFFGKEGFIGENLVLLKPNTHKCKVNVFQVQSFIANAKESSEYTIVFLQTVLISQKYNIVPALLQFPHQILISMLVPGRFIKLPLFQLMSDIEKNVLNVFYEPLDHNRLQGSNHLTGRRQQLLYYQIYVLKRKNLNQEETKNIRSFISPLLSSFKYSGNKGEQGVDYYQTKELVDLYLDFHYENVSLFDVNNYPAVCAERAISIAVANNLKGRALDIGCAVGRCAIDMAVYFDQVVGVDLSSAFISKAQQKLKELSEVTPSIKDKVTFAVGDASNLDHKLGKFDLIFGGNLIDRLKKPQDFLKHISSFLNPNGILILSSPYTWLAEFTPVANWIGGIIQNNHPISTQQGLKRILLSKGFKELKECQDIRFVYRVNPWIYEYTLANVTFWIKSQ